MILSAPVFAAAAESLSGGGYTASGQIKDVGFVCEIYDATNGLPTSDGNYIMSADDGYIWIGGYSGIIRYDGATFERLDPSEGLTSGRVLFEDSRRRIWAGTNDNGVVVLDAGETVRYTYEDGLPSSSIRSFAEDGDGIIYIGSTAGLSYVDGSGHLNNIDDERLNDRTIARLTSDADGTVYGNTKDGIIFSVRNAVLSEAYTSEDLGTEMITAVYPDPDNTGSFYFGSENSIVYYGSFGDKEDDLQKINVDPVASTNWITSACDRIWINSDNTVGFIDKDLKFHVLENIPMHNSIEMMTSDYQGNLWFASSRQGIMKLVTCNFQDITKQAGLDIGTTNSTCVYGDLIYIGADSGLYAVDKQNRPVDNEITRFLADTRIRCTMRDDRDNMWISTFTNDKGLVKLSASGKITAYKEEDGLPNNRIRCTAMAKDGSILVGTNDGLAVIKDDKVVRAAGSSDVMTNTMLLTVCEGEDGEILAGSDGDGIYVIKDDGEEKIGRKDGLTSDVILRIRKDDARGLYWIVTSNSIQYMKDRKITNVSSFPYNNNFDLFPDDSGNMWILSSTGVFCVNADDMLNDDIRDIRLYDYSMGLPAAPTANCFSDIDENGMLYIADRAGVCSVNINRFHEEQPNEIRTGIRSIECNNEEIEPDESGVYTIPAVKGRITITPAILDYSMTNPLINVFLDGAEDTGITVEQKELTALEYTDLKYGNYTLHIQVLDKTSKEAFQDATFRIVKKPMFFERLAVRILGIALLVIAAGLIVWRVLAGTIIRRQYEQIRIAKEEADRANSAKSQFLAEMSHEIRTPINAVLGMNEMILRESHRASDESLQKESGVGESLDKISVYSGNIQRAGSNLLSIINDILDFSKIEEGKMEITEAPYSLGVLLNDIGNMVFYRAGEKGLEFETDVDDTLPDRLCGDEVRVRQVITNILTNAVKYTNKGSVRLIVRRSEEDAKQDKDMIRLRIMVEDTGIGIREEDLEKLFAKFQRVDLEQNSTVEGTGLGLAIARQLLELMNGTIDVTSEYGSGSVFTMEIPQKVVSSEPIGDFAARFKDSILSADSYRESFRAPDAHILIVDDTAMNLTVATGLLADTGIRIDTAAGGREAVELAEATAYDVILMDQRMPEMDGTEALKRIREQTEGKNTGTPVICMTADALKGAKERYLAEGFTDYLSKPVKGSDLEQVLMKYLPEDKIMKVTDERKAIKEDTDSGIYGELCRAGIDTEKGLFYSQGMEDLYQTLLKEYEQGYDERKDGIRKYYNEQDLENYATLVHALKSTSRTIGAVNVSEKAAALEKAADEGDMRAVTAGHDDLLAQYESVVRAIRQALAKEPQQDTDDDEMIEFFPVDHND